MTSYLHRNGHLYTVSEHGRETYLSSWLADSLLLMWTRLAADPLEEKVFRRHAKSLADSLRAAITERDTPRPEPVEDVLAERALESVA